MNSRVHRGANVKCPFCTRMFTNLTGVCLHLESGNCTSGVNRQKINNYCRLADPDQHFTNKQIGWYDDNDDGTAEIATGAAWDGSCYRCYLCQRGFNQLPSLNQHLASPAHRQNEYHCPRCPTQFKALSGLINHLESEKCGEFRFQKSDGGFAFVGQLSLGQ